MMPLKLRQIIMLSISAVCIVVASVFVYQNFDVVRKTFDTQRPHAANTPQDNPPPSAADRLRPRISDSEPSIPRPTRPAYPDHPTVAVLDFGVDRDTYLGEQTAIALSELVRQFLAVDSTYQFVERSEIARVREEHELGLFATSNPADRLELGCWLKAHLIVTGRFVDVSDPDQALELSVIDTVTAERVVKRRIAFAQALNDLSSIDSPQVEALAEAVRSMLGDAHERLVQARDARIVSLLFFRNVSKTDRLTHLEFNLPEKLSALAEADQNVRLVRLHDPTLAMDEQELMLIGLSADNVDAWQTAADYYMWGLIEEREPDQENGTEVDPDELPVDITLVLWHGYGPPVEIKQTELARDVQSAVEQACQRAWDVVGGELPDKVSLSSRDEMVKLLIKTTDSLKLSTQDDPRSWPVKRLMLYQDRILLAWFLNPGNGYVGKRTITLYPATGIDQPWSYLRRALNQTDRVIRRNGLRRYISQDGQQTDRSYDWIDVSLFQHKKNILEHMLIAVEHPRSNVYEGTHAGGGFVQRLVFPQLNLPEDVPWQQRAVYVEQIAKTFARLGEEVAQELARAPLLDATGARQRTQQFRYRDSELIKFMLELEHATPATRVHVFEAWWPIIREEWLQRVATADEYPGYGIRESIRFITRSFEQAGLSDRYAKLYNLRDQDKPLVNPKRDQDPANTHIINVRQLKQDIADLRAEGKLQQPRWARSDRPSKRTTNDSNNAITALRQLRDDANKDSSNYESVNRTLRLNDLRYADPDVGYRSGPRHPDATQIKPVSLRFSWSSQNRSRRSILTRGEYLERITRVSWHEGQLLALASDTPRTRYSRRSAPTYRILTLNPLTGVSSVMCSDLPESIKIHDAKYVAGRFWLATGQDGLVRYDPESSDYDSFTGEHGLSSRHLERLIVLDDKLIVIDQKGQTSLASDLEQSTPLVKDLNIPGGKRLPFEFTSALGHTLLAGNNKDAFWYNHDTQTVITARQWIDRHISDHDAGDTLIWCKQSGGFYWIMLTDKLIRIHPGLETWEVYPAPTPPFNDMTIHYDGQVLWLAYSWSIEPLDTSEDVAQTNRSATDPGWKTQVVAYLPGNDKASGQWQMDGRVTGMTNGNGELYLVNQNWPWDVYAYDIYTILKQMGTSVPASVASQTYQDNAQDRTAPQFVDHVFFGDTNWVQAQINTDKHLVSMADSDGWSALHYAVRGGHADMVQLLLNAGANPNHVSSTFPAVNPIILATIMNRTDILELLHSHGARLDMQTDDYGTPVLAAICHQQHQALQWLIDRGAPFDNRIAADFHMVVNVYGGVCQISPRPLFWAIEQGDEQALDILLKAGADPSATQTTDFSNVASPLVFAISQNRLEMLPRLLQAGADLTQQYGKRSRSILQVALEHQNVHAAEILYEAGAEKLDISPEVLLLAAELGSQTLVEKIVERGVDLNTPVAGKPYVVGSYRRIPYGSTAATRAVHGGQLDLYEWMLNEGGLDLDQVVEPYRQGDLLVSKLIAIKDYERAIDLIAKGYSVDTRQYVDGPTRLMVAARDNSREEAKLLLRLGADPNVTDARGKSAIDLADNPKMRQILEAHE